MYLALDFHTISQMDRELPDVPESMLICCTVVHAKQLGGGVLHEVNGGKSMDTRRLARAD